VVIERLPGTAAAVVGWTSEVMQAADFQRLASDTRPEEFVLVHRAPAASLRFS
jgi:hypothetical protein